MEISKVYIIQNLMNSEYFFKDMGEYSVFTFNLLNAHTFTSYMEALEFLKDSNFEGSYYTIIEILDNTK